MNRYQQEVAAMDQRHRLVMRGLSFAGAAMLVVAALWSAGLPPSVWIERADQWFASLDVSETPATQLSVTAMPLSEPQSPSAPVASPRMGTDSVIPPTPLPLYLVSTSPGRNSNEGTALIGTNPDHPQTYVGGAILTNGARLAEIYSDRVVLQRNGKELIIYISADKHAAQAKRIKGWDDLAMVGGPAASAPEVVKLAEDHLTDVIRSMPFYESDLFAGLQIFPGQKTGIFSQLGLQSGDVIIVLDGAPVADFASALDLLRTLIDGAAMTATVRRDGQKKTVSLDGSIVAKAVTKPDPTMQAESLAGAAPM